jgi:hypothetical protein
MMSENLAFVIERVREAVHGAQNEFRSLYATVDKGSIPMSLSVAGTGLESLAGNMELLAGSTAALSSDFVRALFDTCMTVDVKLSDAITNDMHAVASRLRLMMPSDSSEPLIAIEEYQCRDIADMVDRYNRTISFTLIHPYACVRSSMATLIIHSPLYRSSLDALVDGTHSVLAESVVAELRESMT